MVNTAKENVTVSRRSKSSKDPNVTPEPYFLYPLSLSLVLSCMKGPSFLSVSRGMELCQISLSSFKWLYYMASNRIESFQAEHILHQSNPTRRKIFSTLPPIKSCHAAMYSKKTKRQKVLFCMFISFLGATTSCWGSWSGMDCLISEAPPRYSGVDLTSPVHGGN